VASSTLSSAECLRLLIAFATLRLPRSAHQPALMRSARKVLLRAPQKRCLDGKPNEKIDSLSRRVISQLPRRTAAWFESREPAE
jgi:hypothetical protein